MARKDSEDRMKLQDQEKVISTDDLKSVGELRDDDRVDVGAFGGSDAPSSDSAEYVLVRKYRDDGVPYEEQVHASEFMLLEDQPEVVAEESGGRSNVSFEHSEYEDEPASSSFRSLRSGDSKSDEGKDSKAGDSKMDDSKSSPKPEGHGG